VLQMRPRAACAPWSGLEPGPEPAVRQSRLSPARDPTRVRCNVLEVATDYFAMGIDPNVTTICVQSALPAPAELTVLYLNFVSVVRPERNPTIKVEILARNFGSDIPAGFFGSAALAADITAFKATVVPVSKDQASIIKQTNEIVRRLNRQAGRDLLPEASN
jgi:tryptophanyl-tRNA synthetase